MNPLNEFIRSAITSFTHQWAGAAAYRAPLVGFASSDNVLFRTFQTLIAPDRYLPGDLLHGGQAVISFFLPFTPELVQKNLSTPDVAKAGAGRANATLTQSQKFIY
jgi:epoxyqueuosine reductase QueG